jgi:type I restriction enzyme, S subunit
MSDQRAGLPRGWVWATVQELGALKVGRQRSPKHHSGAHMRPYLRVANVFEDRLDLSDVKEMNFTPAEYEIYQLRPGDILLNEGQSPELLGRPAIYRGEIAGACFQNTLIRYRPRGELLPEFALIVFRYYMHSGRFRRLSRQTTNMAHLSAGRLSTVEVPVPPKQEQRRIVEEVDKQLTRLDAAAASLKRAQVNLKRYRAVILQAACEGRLVPTEAALAQASGLNYEHADQLLVRRTPSVPALKKRAGRLWGAGAVPVLTQQERATLPAGWVWTKVRYLSPDADETVQVGPMSMRSQDFTGSGVPVLNVGCVRWGSFDESKLNFLPAERAAEFGRYRIQPGDVLFTRSGTVGRCAVARDHQRDWLITFHLLRVRTDGRVCVPEYLRAVLEGADHISRQTREASIGTTRAGFNTNLLADLDIPLPPLAEQIRIVHEVDARLSQVSALESSVRNNLARSDRLRRSVLKRAVEGSLVSQDPSDEPGGVLLARSNAERGAAVRTAKDPHRKLGLARSTPLEIPA